MDLLQIFTLVTGVIYIFLEIRQKSLMWVVGVLTSLAAMIVFFRQGLYASFLLNTYYLITSFVGIVQWRRDRSRLEVQEPETDVIHLNRLTMRTFVISMIVLVAGTSALAHLMELLENPMSYLDSFVTVMSAVATWWLVRSYLQQWWLWILADALSAILCATQGMWWMSLLYFFYSASAVYGYIHWARRGRYVS